jgi:hypothetical protein
LFVRAIVVLRNIVAMNVDVLVLMLVLDSQQFDQRHHERLRQFEQAQVLEHVDDQANDDGDMRSDSPECNRQEQCGFVHEGCGGGTTAPAGRSDRAVNVSLALSTGATKFSVGSDSK